MTAETVARTPAAAQRVSTLELFFDLVFVFTITQLSQVLAHDLRWSSLAHVAIMLGAIWYMYAGYAWLTNAIATDALVNGLLLLAGMCGYFILALAIPHAFDDGGTAFGLGFVFVVLVHAWLFGHSAGEGGARGILRLARSNIPGALLILLGGVLGGDAQVVLWSVAVLLLWIVPRVVGIESFEVAPGHFVERHGLVIIVAIGESVVAIGIGASALPIDVELALVAALGLLLSAGLWWTYFGGDDVRAEEALVRLPPRRRPLAALDAFGYAHYLMLLGIVCLAVGLKQATAHAYDPLSAGRALVLAGGVATFLAADVWFRRILRIGAAPARVAGAALALATIPVGTRIAAIAQVLVLVVVVAASAAGTNVLTSKDSVSKL